MQKVSRTFSGVGAILCVALSLCHSSCIFLDSNLPPKKYPDSLTLDGYGVLRYEQTLLDDIPLFFAVKSGSDIIALSETSVYVIEASENRIKKSVKLQFDENESVFYSTDLICPPGKYVVVSRFFDGKESSYRLHSIDSGTLDTEKRDITGYISNKYNEKIGYIRSLSETSKHTYVLKAWEGSTYNDLYYETADFKEWIKIEKEEGIDKGVTLSDHLTENGITYFIDDRSAVYSDTYLCASRDNGLTWSEASLGTNYGRSILVDGDTVWIACFGYHEQVFIVSSNMIGGGLHKMRWSYQ